MSAENSRTPTALISVSDKAGIVEFAGKLVSLGWSLLSTGGTAALLAKHGIDTTEVSAHTGFPEIMGGRVKTLHPKIHGGILARRGTDEEVAASHDISMIDMVVVNLYPFNETVAQPNCTLEAAIENIDIGGPAMVRAAAKNHASVTIVTDSADYPRVLESILSSEGLSQSLRFDLAVKAFEHTASYDGAIANYLGAKIPEETSSGASDQSLFPRTYNLQFTKRMDLRYGENPHQDAAFYVEKIVGEGTVAGSEQLQGKELSFNNIADTDTALSCVSQFRSSACVIVKHANPCGIAEVVDVEKKQQLTAYLSAFATDPTSAFGGIIAFNRILEGETASAIVGQQFVEVVIAPGISTEARNIFEEKGNVRLLDCGSVGQSNVSDFHYSRVKGGLLVQQADDVVISGLDDSGSVDQQLAALQVVTDERPTQTVLRDLLFAWKTAWFVKSNAIVYARDGQTLGVGAGQMSRVYSSRIAAIKASDASLDLTGAVMASDAFFPFRDGIDAAAEAGIAAVIQPGGSRNDAEVIDAANEHGMVMVFTGTRHFRH